MAYYHCYWGIENLGLNDTQRAVIIDELRRLGPSSNPQPCMLNHWRIRLDGQAAIFEALWDEALITIDAFRQRLANLFDIDPATIDSSVGMFTFDTRQSAVVTFSRNGTNYLRVVFFGYAGNSNWPTCQESGDECRAYLALYRDLWEQPEDVMVAVKLADRIKGTLARWLWLILGALFLTAGAVLGTITTLATAGIVLTALGFICVVIGLARWRAANGKHR